MTKKFLITKFDCLNNLKEHYMGFEGLFRSTKALCNIHSSLVWKWMTFLIWKVNANKSKSAALSFKRFHPIVKTFFWNYLDTKREIFTIFCGLLRIGIGTLNETNIIKKSGVVVILFEIDCAIFFTKTCRNCFVSS